jgi:hypothetical protein
MQEENQHTENVFAFNDEFKIIYIDDVAYVDRGTQKKYFCLGCKRQMQAVKPQTLRKAHFRHHVKPNSNETKCTYSDETYRHHLAKANAIDFKKIKVPSVYKFSPNKNDEKAFLIKESEFIEAHSVVNEHYVFENDNGEIQVVKDYNELEGNHLFIKPDTIFLDENKKPILIVEFVVTHKPDQQKLMKLKRLGINAIQVSVPKSSPEEIRELFFKTNRTKWLFNNDENEANYFQLSDTNAGRILEIDFEQRRLFEEGYACRKAQLGDFIRAIRRVLESELYKDTERNLRSEIRRVEENTEREAAELEELRRNHIESGITQHKERRDDVGNRKKEFQDYRINLEERYFRKRSEIEREQNEIGGKFSEVEVIEIGDIQLRNELYRAIEDNDRKRRRIENDCFNEESTSELLQNNVTEEERRIERSIKIEKRKIELLSIEFNKLEEEERTDFERRIKEVDRIKRDIKSSEGKNLLTLAEEIRNGNNTGDEEYSKEYRALDQYREAIKKYLETKRTYDELRERL